MENQNTPKCQAGRQMSATLRERLKRSGRSYMSPALSKNPRKERSASPRLKSAIRSETNISKDSTDVAKTSGLCFDPAGAVCSPKERTDLQAATWADENSAQKSNVNVEASDVTARNAGVLLVHGNMPHSTKKNSSLQEHTPGKGLTSDSSSDRTDKSCIHPKFDENELVSSSKCDSSKEKTTDGQVEICERASTDCQSRQRAQSLDDLKCKKHQLQQRIAQKEEQLRKLKMVQMYRSKNDLTTLQSLIDKWRGAIPESLQQLWEHLDEPRPSMTRLIEHLQLDPAFIQYDPEDESFH